MLTCTSHSGWRSPGTWHVGTQPANLPPGRRLCAARCGCRATTRAYPRQCGQCHSRAGSPHKVRAWPAADQACETPVLHRAHCRDHCLSQSQHLLRTFQSQNPCENKEVSGAESETTTPGNKNREREKQAPRQSTLQIPDVGKTPAWRSLRYRQTQAKQNCLSPMSR